MDHVERELLKRCWFPIARSQDLDARGVAGGTILGQELVVFRGPSGVTVAEGYCPHRGALLSMGALVEGDLECPYHGWRFESGTGRLTCIPSLPAHIPPMKLALKTYPAREAYGHIWSCLEEPYLPFPQMKWLDQADWQFMYGEPWTLHCGIRQLTENFRDMSHFPFVHRGSMGPNVRREVDEYEVAREGWDLEWTLTTDLGGTALQGRKPVASVQTLTYHLTLPTFVYIQTRFPDGGRRLVGQFSTPISEDGEWCRQYWFAGIDSIVATQHGVSLPEMFAYEDQIFAEDRPIVENQKPREAPLELNTQVHTRADRFSIAYRRLYLELLDTFAQERGLERAAGRDGAARAARVD